SADSVAAAARPGGGGDRRAPDVSRGPAPGRVRAHRQGPRAGAFDRGHAGLRPRLARVRPGRRDRAFPRRARGRDPRAGRRSRLAPGGFPVRIALAADELTGVAGELLEELRRRGMDVILHGAYADGERPDWAWASERAA